MVEERRGADVPVTPEEVAHRGFATSFRGFDPAEVRAYLGRVAEALRTVRERQRELERQLREAATSAASVPIDESSLVTALGEHTARIVRSAHEAATDIRAQSEEAVQKILRDAHEDAHRVRADAERVLADTTSEAEAQAAAIRHAAEADAEGIRRRAEEHAAAVLDRARGQGKEVMAEAQALRNRVLGDLLRKRRVAVVQVEQLQAGRERLLDAYRTVRHTLDDATTALERAESEARAAAEAAAVRAQAEPEPTAEELGFTRTPPVVGTAPPPAAPFDRSRMEPTGPAPAGGSGDSHADTEAGDDEPAGSRRRFSRDPDRSSSVRVFRRPADEADEEPDEEVPRPPASLTVVPPPSDIESVRVVRGDEVRPADEPQRVREQPPAVAAAGDPSESDASEPDAAEVDIEAAEVEVAEPAVSAGVEALHPEVAGADTPGDGGDEGDAHKPAAAAETDVHALFERIRAGTDVAPEQEEQHTADEAADPELPAAAGDDSWLQRRADALGSVEAAATRRLKRALQDEQNEVLDRLRRDRSRKPSMEAAFPNLAEHEQRVRELVAPFLAEAYRLGAAVSSGDGDRADEAVAAHARALAEELSGPLHRRVGASLDEAASLGEDEATVAQRVSAAYREWKTERIGRLACDHLVAAYSAGEFAGWRPGTKLRWVVHDIDGRCPDCDDNALAGSLAKGEMFPTGQVHPPAHPGCRCALIPVAVSAPASA